MFSTDSLEWALATANIQQEFIMFSTFNRIPLVSIGFYDDGGKIKIVFASDEDARANYLDLKNANKLHQYVTDTTGGIGVAFQKASAEILKFLDGSKNSAPSIA